MHDRPRLSFLCLYSVALHRVIARLRLPFAALLPQS